MYVPNTDKYLQTKSPRWSRISQLTPVQETELKTLTEQTAGMSLYGNRARTSVMLPLELAKIISEEAKSRNCTVNQVMVDMLYNHNLKSSPAVENVMEPMTRRHSTEH